MQLPYVESVRIEDGETSVTAIDDAEDDAPDVELPPPMKPIQVNYQLNERTIN